MKPIEVPEGTDVSKVARKAVDEVFAEYGGKVTEHKTEVVGISVSVDGVDDNGNLDTVTAITALKEEDAKAIARAKRSEQLLQHTYDLVSCADWNSEDFAHLEYLLREHLHIKEDGA